jgi:hypothetical protein
MYFRYGILDTGSAPFHSNLRFFWPASMRRRDDFANGSRDDDTLGCSGIHELSRCQSAILEDLSIGGFAIFFIRLGRNAYQAFLNFLMLHPLHYHIDMDAIQSRLEQFLDRRLSLAQAAMSGIAAIEFCEGPERQLTDGPYFPLRQTDPVAFGSPPTAERFRDTRMHAPI